MQASGHNTILKMMKALGEEHFRRIEDDMLVRLMLQGGNLIALGGGGPNWGLNQVLHKRGDILLIWLDTPLEQCLANLRKDHKNVRPLMKLGEQRVRALYRERREIYSAAQVQIDYEKLQTVKNYPRLVAEIERQILKE